MLQNDSFRNFFVLSITLQKEIEHRAFYECVCCLTENRESTLFRYNYFVCLFVDLLLFSGHCVSRFVRFRRQDPYWRHDNMN